MYLAFFGIAEKPFAITPDPRYLYLGRHHADALAHLVYGINDAGGFIQLTGEVGTGKTTTIRSLLARAPKQRGNRSGHQPAALAAGFPADDLRGTRRRRARRCGRQRQGARRPAQSLSAARPRRRAARGADRRRGAEPERRGARAGPACSPTSRPSRRSSCRSSSSGSRSCASCWPAMTCASSRSASPRASTCSRWRARRRSPTCATGCASPGRPAKYSREARCARCTG